MLLLQPFITPSPSPYGFISHSVGSGERISESIRNTEELVMAQYKWQHFFAMFKIYILQSSAV
jgi:hypothetical protein